MNGLSKKRRRDRKVKTKKQPDRMDLLFRLLSNIKNVAAIGLTAGVFSLSLFVQIGGGGDFAHKRLLMQTTMAKEKF